VSGELDVMTGPTLLDHVAIALVDNVADRQTSLAIDLSGVTFIDSSGLQVLLRTREVAVERGVDAVVTGASPAVRRLLDLTGTSDLLERPAE